MSAAADAREAQHALWWEFVQTLARVGGYERELAWWGQAQWYGRQMRDWPPGPCHEFALRDDKVYTAQAAYRRACGFKP